MHYFPIALHFLRLIRNLFGMFKFFGMKVNG